MDTMRRRRAALLAVTCLVGWAAAGPAAAGGDGAALGLRAVGQSASHFDVTMRPGEALTLELEITNNSDAQASAYTYAADVYTTVNGGFGGRLREEPTSGATRWLDYNPETLLLAVGSQSIRPFTVSVPDDAGPGEYITSIVLETELIDQRQALAVVVTVPGMRSPALEIGEATHTVVEGTSVLSVAVSNPGNVRLSPMVELDLRDANGAHVTDASLHMDSFYALTDTSVELPLDVLLVEGTYSIELVAEDVQQEIRSRRTSEPRRRGRWDRRSRQRHRRHPHGRHGDRGRETPADPRHRPAWRRRDGRRHYAGVAPSAEEALEPLIPLPRHVGLDGDRPSC